MDYAAARRHMVNTQVRTNDVTDMRIQSALEATPRERFLPPNLRDLAYAEREIALARGRRMLVIRDFAKLLSAAEPRPSDLVLDVACGAGYSAAVLASLCEMVVALESDADMCAEAQKNLSDLGITNAAVVAGELTEGARDEGPFDLIFIGAAIESEPNELLAQLKDGGRLVTIRRENGVSRGGVYHRSNGAVGFRAVFDATAATILPGFGSSRGFAF